MAGAGTDAKSVGPKGSPGCAGGVKATAGSERVVHGGSWNDNPTACRNGRSSARLLRRLTYPRLVELPKRSEQRQEHQSQETLSQAQPDLRHCLLFARFHASG